MSSSEIVTEIVKGFQLKQSVKVPSMKGKQFKEVISLLRWQV